MAKDKLTDYDSTASGNLDVGGISVAEGMLPSGVNNAIREQMSHLADFAAGTSGVDVLKLQDDTDTNSIKLQAPASVTATTTFTLPDGDGASGQAMITDGAGTLSWAAPYGNRNLIINGAKVIDQRNAGASVSGDGQFPVDRWKASKVGAGAFSMQQSSTAPSGFNHSVVCTVTTADTSIAASDEYSYRHFVEAFNFSHANWGTSSAYPVTLSFWVRSSVTGTYAVGFRNNAGNRTNPSTYTISSANTWEYKTITVAGDTTGTWEGASNSIGVGVIFSLGAGSNFQGTANTWNASGTWSTASATQWISNSGATFYITGIQLEVGSTATPFEHRSYGDELARCQRYYSKVYIAADWTNNLFSAHGITYPVNMRAEPTIAYDNQGIETNIASVTFGVGGFTNKLTGTTVQIESANSSSRTYIFKRYYSDAEL